MWLGVSEKRQFHGTWSHTCDPNLKAPEQMPKHEFGELLVQLFDDYVCRNGSADVRKRSRLNKLGKLGVWAELHKHGRAAGKAHYHFPVLAEEPWDFHPLQQALRNRKIYVDFSMEHDYYWTNVVYLATPSALPEGKTQMELDHDPWLSPGHPTVADCLEDMPRGARATDKTRVRRYLGLGGGRRCEKHVLDR